MNPPRQSSQHDVTDYDTQHMKYLNDVEHVRKLSGMYIGDLGEHGLHHLVHEVIDNSIDEAMAGHASRIVVTVRNDHSIAVEDDGRGIPVSYDESIQKSALEGAMTVLKYSGKFDDDAYDRPGGLHGIGLKAVNFLSEWCRVTVCRGGRMHRQTYQRGEPVESVQDLGATDTTGTKTEFLPDHEKFGDLVFDYVNLRRRMQDAAFLNRGVTVEFLDERKLDAPREVFQYERGLVEFIEHRNHDRNTIHPEVVIVGGDLDNISIEAALQYVASDMESVDCYANNIHNQEGGTHLKGFRSGLIRCLRTYGKQQDLFRKVQPISEDFREGLVAVVSVRISNPVFESQHKLRLTNAIVESKVSSVIAKQVGRFLEENPVTANAILKRVLIAAEARELARSKKEAIETSGKWGGSGLPGKLRDCTTSDVSRRELYLVEGDSAGGSAEGGRLKETQAILPLRGKLINAIKSRDDKVLSHEEVQSVIQAIGIGIGPDQALANRRYEKIIIMTDADVDGSHIRTLLLCFFYRQMSGLIEAGHVYVAQPPLFRVRSRKQTYYVQTEAEMRRQLLEKGLTQARLETDDGQNLETAQLHDICDILAMLEEAILAIKRMGISLITHAQRADVSTGLLPVYRCDDQGRQHWLLNLDESMTSAESKNTVTEFEQVKTINAGLVALSKFGFDVTSLYPVDRTGIDLPRYVLHHDDNETELDDLRALLPAIRTIGEKGLQVTRFKGLGEMNADELRETTLDPANRTLVQITMDNVTAANRMFQLLMGHDVKPRRAFIEEHALEIEKLDV